MKFIKFIFLILFIVEFAYAGSQLEVIAPPHSYGQYSLQAELDDDVYSGDIALMAEYEFCSCFSLYMDVSYRLLSYSYEYSTEGYIHNYVNLHVNGFNKTYLGAKIMAFKNFGVDVSFGFPPGEGSQKNPQHHLKVEPFGYYSLKDRLKLGLAFGYNVFLEKSNYKPGDEIGIKTSFIWEPFGDALKNSKWRLSEVFLVQHRIEESENRNLSKPYEKMDDKYWGYKMKFSLTKYFGFMRIPFGVGIYYQMQRGTLFGFETGHTIGLFMRMN